MVGRILKAYGHRPEWGPGGLLTPASRTAVKAIDLHSHDLRHEGQVARHAWAREPRASESYLNVEKNGLQDSMRRFGLPAGIRCDPVAISAPCRLLAPKSRHRIGAAIR